MGLHFAGTADTLLVLLQSADFFGFLQKPRPTSFARNSCVQSTNRKSESPFKHAWKRETQCKKRTDETTEKPKPCATQSRSVDSNWTGTGLAPAVRATFDVPPVSSKPCKHSERLWECTYPVDCCLRYRNGTRYTRRLSVQDKSARKQETGHEALVLLCSRTDRSVVV